MNAKGRFLQFDDYIKWPPVQELISQNTMDLAAIEKKWNGLVGSNGKSADLPTFMKLYESLGLKYNGSSDVSKQYLVGEFSNLVDFVTKAGMKANVLQFSDFMKWVKY